jgi:RecA-family ATPase
VEGDVFSLPQGNDFTPEAYRFCVIGDLPLLTLDDLARGIDIKGYQPTVDSPLRKFSVRGMSEEFERNAVIAEPLLGHIVMAGQATILFAPPNAGKTLIVLSLLMEAIDQRRINPENVYYINADDSSEGLATKLRLMDDIGVHTLVPGHRGFAVGNLVELFHSIASADKAKGTLVIIDTLKKAASLMDKGKASEFTDAVRTFVMKGGTVVALGHTNKTPSASGKLQYSGTTDIRDDLDAAYIVTPMELEGFEGERAVCFELIKARGRNVQAVVYAYASGPDVSYVERLASVRLVDGKELEGFRVVAAEKADADIIAAIEACIRERDFAKMALAKEAAKRSGASNRAAMRIIETYTGTDPATHKWTFVRKDRGAMIYTLLSGPEEEPEPLAA